MRLKDQRIVIVEEYMQQTPLMVGSPQQIVVRYAGMRETFGTTSGSSFS